MATFTTTADVCDACAHDLLNHENDSSRWTSVPESFVEGLVAYCFEPTKATSADLCEVCSRDVETHVVMSITRHDC